MLSARLVLVRHGQSTWNADGLLQGQADPPLSAAGRAEAAALAPFLRGFPAERVRASDLRRARETAELAGHPDPGLDPRLREIDVGEWAGRPLAELPRGAEVSWRAGSQVPPGGEPWEALARRVEAALDELLAAGGSWLVVAHGGVIRAAIAGLTGVAPTRIAGPANASVTVYDPARGQLLAYAWTPDGGVPGLA
jgi:glucosyl-3-phosphoglycerate phosphatase